MPPSLISIIDSGATHKAGTPWLTQLKSGVQLAKGKDGFSSQLLLAPGGSLPTFLSFPPRQLMAPPSFTAAKVNRCILYKNCPTTEPLNHQQQRPPQGMGEIPLLSAMKSLPNLNGEDQLASRTFLQQQRLWKQAAGLERRPAPPSLLLSPLL